MKVIKDSLRLIASLGPVGKLPYNRFWAPLAAAPIGLILHSARTVPTLLWTVIAPVLTLLVALVFYVRTYIQNDRAGTVILDRCIGAVIITALIPSHTPKFFVFSALTYLGVLTGAEYLIKLYEPRIGIMRRGELPTHIVLSIAILSLGMLSFIWWVAH